MAKSYKRHVKRAIKNTHGVTLFFAVLFLALGAAGGYFGYSYLTKTDTFELVGEKEITLNVGETFTDEGFKAVAFGKDVSDKVQIEGNVDTSTEGTYVLTYTVNNLKYKDVKRCRVINVVEE